MGTSTGSWASARSIQVAVPPASATARVISAAVSPGPGARGRNSSTVPAASGCVCGLRMSRTRRSASAAHRAAREPGSSVPSSASATARRRSRGRRAAPDGPAGRVSAAGRAPVSLTGGSMCVAAVPPHVEHRRHPASTTADTTSRGRAVGPCPVGFATASATATAVNSAASSTTSRRSRWCAGRPFGPGHRASLESCGRMGGKVLRDHELILDRWDQACSVPFVAFSMAGRSTSCPFLTDQPGPAAASW